MSGIKFYIADTETTGLHLQLHEIVELSIIRYDDKLQLSRTIRAMQPKNASFDALRITGKTIADLYQGIHFSKAVEDANNFINMDGLTPPHRCLVGHNIVNFDKKFLWALWEKCGQKFPIDLYLDTLDLSRKSLSSQGIKKRSLKLESALEIFGVKKVGTFHNAVSDTRNTYLLFKKLMDSDVDYLSSIKSFPHGEVASINSEEDDLLAESLE